MHSCCPQVPSSPAKPGSLLAWTLHQPSVWPTPCPCPLDLHWVCQCHPNHSHHLFIPASYPGHKALQKSGAPVSLPLSSLPSTLATLDASGSSVGQRTLQGLGQYLVHCVYPFICQWMLALSQLLSILNDACCGHGCPHPGFLIIFPFICSFPLLLETHTILSSYKTWIFQNNPSFM